ncbi:MAG: nuclear transport factor 2 family protein, partial [Pseudolabrys sp.]
MSIHLPIPIEQFMSSENARDPDALAACFAPDATLRDEGRTREGLKNIVAWQRETTDKYQH